MLQTLNAIRICSLDLSCPFNPSAPPVPICTFPLRVQFASYPAGTCKPRGGVLWKPPARALKGTPSRQGLAESCSRLGNPPAPALPTPGCASLLSGVSAPTARRRLGGDWIERLGRGDWKKEIEDEDWRGGIGAAALPLPLPLRRRGLGRAPTGECRASRTADGSQEEASDSPPSRSGLQGSSYIRRDGSESCFLAAERQRSAPVLRGCGAVRRPGRKGGGKRRIGRGCAPYLFSRRPLPVSRKPLAKGLLSIFSWVICGDTERGCVTPWPPPRGPRPRSPGAVGESPGRGRAGLAAKGAAFPV